MCMRLRWLLTVIGNGFRTRFSDVLNSDIRPGLTADLTCIEVNELSTSSGLLVSFRILAELLCKLTWAQHRETFWNNVFAIIFGKFLVRRYRLMFLCHCFVFCLQKTSFFWTFEWTCTVTCYLFNILVHSARNVLVAAAACDMLFICGCAKESYVTCSALTFLSSTFGAWPKITPEILKLLTFSVTVPCDLLLFTDGKRELNATQMWTVFKICPGCWMC